jgi:hypothetical protein
MDAEKPGDLRGRVEFAGFHIPDVEQVSKDQWTVSQCRGR